MNMQHFDIAKYLREHQQGSFGILNHYIDLKPLKEEREEIFDKSDPESGEDALEWILDNIEGPDKDRILDNIQIYDKDKVRDADPEDIVDMINGVIEDHEINFDEDEDRFQLTIVSIKKDMEEDKDLGQQDAMPEPYEGPEDPIDGLGGELDRDMDVSMNEEEDTEEMENAWMKDVDGTEAYEVGKWKCYYSHPGILVWSYNDKPFSEIAIYATPNYDGDDTTPIQIVVGEENEDMMSLNQGIFTDFNEYAKAMKPYLDRIENLESNRGSLAELENVNEVSAFEEKRKYYEGEVNDIVYDMMDTTGADKDEVADFFQYISTKIRNEGIF